VRKERKLAQQYQASNIMTVTKQANGSASNNSAIISALIAQF
jgi:hypothetical protein